MSPRWTQHDLDGDGQDDLVLYTSTATIGLAGPFGTSSAPVDLFAISGDDWWEGASAGDVNADGFLDLALGDPAPVGEGGGDARIFLGPVSGSLSLDDATASVEGTLDGMSLGYGVSIAGDLDGDGDDDIVVGAPHDVELGGRHTPMVGVVLVWWDLWAGETSAETADLVLDGSPGDFAGQEVATDGDVDGDGRDDLLIGAPTAVPGTHGYNGLVSLVHGADLAAASGR